MSLQGYLMELDARPPGTVWGVMEVDVLKRRDGLNARSVFWGLESRAEAELLANFGNRIRGMTETHVRGASTTTAARQYTVFTRPYGSVELLLPRNKSLSADVPDILELSHSPADWTALVMHANEQSLIKPGARKGSLRELMHRTFRHFVTRFKTISKTLPPALMHRKTHDCFLRPGMLRDLLAGGSAYKSDSSQVRKRKTYSSDDDDDDDDDEEEEEDSAAASDEQHAEDDDDDAMDVDE